MKINWSVRLKNPQFWIAIGIVFFANLFAMSGITFEEVTSWGKLGSLIFDALKNPYTFINLGAFVYVAVIDFTTKGIGDSDLVMSRLQAKSSPKK
ncbi:phage holin [Lysinibacillus sp. BPa_S21]|uniref:phage holin n=1 Tax=Lysinibacillus sp. BPa_S21 TaxID=2932478 RepID=UPI002011F20C|nr:phage holin [Lysinibacillus sp. BPa_S21]MCL1696247.1 phage holin family protein [Lysinibacillus sp. BPa_S21]